MRSYGLDQYTVGLTFSMAYSMNPFSHSTASGSPERGSDELSLRKIQMFLNKRKIGFEEEPE